MIDDQSLPDWVVDKYNSAFGPLLAVTLSSHK